MWNSKSHSSPKSFTSLLPTHTSLPQPSAPSKTFRAAWTIRLQLCSCALSATSSLQLCAKRAAWSLTYQVTTHTSSKITDPTLIEVLHILAIASITTRPSLRTAISPSFSFHNVGHETVFSALHLYFGFFIDRLCNLMPALTVLLNRPLKISELNYIGYTVKEPLSGKEDATIELPESQQTPPTSAVAATGEPHQPTTGEQP